MAVNNNNNELLDKDIKYSMDIGIFSQKNDS